MNCGINSSETVSNIENGFYQLKSSCTSPTIELVIQLQSLKVLQPIGSGFFDFGFPSDTINLGSVNGLFFGANRRCELSFGNRFENPNEFIYTCLDDEIYVCSIILIKK